jgi:hypothetical protein
MVTALTHMAAARPPGIADARVPCPLCGGLIHPVAGRCKHCKEDLTSFRAGRPQAAAALPALNGRPAPAPVTSVAATTNGTNGHAMATAVPFVLPVAHNDASQPILPPRTTARSVAVARPHSMWRSWPMLVIILAVIAIVAATVIMVMPQDDKKHDGKMSAPPAPERMDMNPVPEKQSQIDPWSGGAPGSVPRAPDPVPMPQPPAAVDPDDDLWGSGGGGGGGLAGGMPGANAANIQLNALVHACTKLKSCPSLDQSDFASVCDAVAMMPKPSPVTGCPAAQRCFDAIDRLDCSDASQASPHSVFTLFSDCAQAANKC